MRALDDRQRRVFLKRLIDSHGGCRNVVSVGQPIDLCARKPSAEQAVSGKVSPQKESGGRTGGARLNVRSTRHISANEGVETHVVMLELASARYSNFGLATRSRLMLTRVPPVTRLQYKSMTDRTKENGA